MTDHTKTTQGGTSLSWDNLGYSVALKKGDLPLEILKGVSGHVQSGKMLAIIGGSGAGKSTLLDILAGRKSTGALSGKVLYSGVPLGEISGGTRRATIGYVTQEDVFKPTMTVREHLQFYADISLSAAVPSRDERWERVERVMRELRIEHRADQRIGSPEEGKKGISGGERKRLSVAEQLISHKSLLFLDEPTSGLDAFNSMELLKLLHALCAQGITVVMTVHQPRSTIFEMFDALLILHKGRTAYFGAAREATAFFASLGYPLPLGMNPADFFIDVVLSSDSSIDFAAAFESRPECKAILEAVRREEAVRTDLLPASVLPNPSPAIQTLVLLKRQFRDTLRNPTAALINIIQSIALGLIVGSIFYQLDFSPSALQSRVGFLIFTLLSGAFPITQTSALLVLERPVINRERAAGLYGTGPYFLTRFLLDAPLHCLLPLLFNSIAYYMIGLRPDASAFFTHIGFVMMNCLVAGSLYTLLGAVSPDAMVANVLSFVLTVFLMLFAGFFVPGPVLPPWWIWMYWASFLRWGFQGLLLNQFQDTGLVGDSIIKLYGFEGLTIWSAALGLLTQVVIFRIATFFALYYLNKEKR